MAIDSTTRKQLRRFVVTGIIAVAVDFGLYYALNTVIDHNLAKGISFLSGTIVAYIFNKYWTFETKEFSSSQLLKFFILYGLTLGVNIITNDVALLMFRNLTFAFLCATGASTILNFLGQKFWVFKKIND
ncbi:GtrA family protein [Zeaxanthinibacter enoshimensis]|uniref:Putative flippase GtrA n=1 Tax=Zeaxanthinibacter enoshimensis TaxID=392009 RepID=A0A4R6TRK6_9FLAO|nr:GtrA family protein [Zeaxanthinibacter enoshimensis]TDQ32773.1 putative flippase GtrA [Zeaxanthinibacter enoshimensis]